MPRSVTTACPIIEIRPPSGRLAGSRRLRSRKPLTLTTGPKLVRNHFDSDYATELTFAHGTAVDEQPTGLTTQVFRVTIRYREPGFEARLGRVGDAYRWTYRIEAIDREAATRDALQQFEETARQSQVSWRRDIVSIHAEPLIDETRTT